MELIYKTIGAAFLLTVLFRLSEALTPSTFLTGADRQRLKKILSSAFPLTDLTTAHYAILGYTLLGEKIPATSEEVCKFLESKIDRKKLDTIYYATSASKHFTNCKLSTTGLQQILDAGISEDIPMQDIYHSVLSLKKLNLKVDSAKVAKVMTAVLKRDDSVANLGYSFHIASKLDGDIVPFFERIEDAIVQADEVDSKFLQFEGGLGITSTSISGVYELAEAAKKAPAITPDQAIKFTNYFLSRKFVQTVKGSAQLINVLNIFTKNKFHIPVAVTLASNSALSPENPDVQIRITNVLGASLGPLTVTVDSAKRVGDEVVVMSRKPLQSVKGTDILYTINFLNTKPLRGFYTVTVNAVPAKADPKLIGNTGAQVSVKVMTEVIVDSCEIGTVDRDQVTQPRSISNLSYPKGDIKLDSDFHQKIFIKFALKDVNAKAAMHAHQAFVQFVGRENKKEVVYVAEHDNTKGYKFDLDVFSKAKDFGYSSGLYDLNLIIGDAVMINPFVWNMGQVTFTLPPNPNPVPPKKLESPYEPKPEIKHVFREKDKRPSALVSNTFSVLTVLPILILFILWFKLGVNLSNFPWSLSAIIFQLSLLAIFGLFTCFWLHLNMFSTLKYLTGLGLIAFLSGHRLLRKLAATKS